MSAEAYREYLSSIAVLTDSEAVLEVRKRDAESTLQLERTAAQDQKAAVQDRWDQERRRFDAIALRARRVIAEAPVAQGVAVVPSEALAVDQFARRVALLEVAVRAASEQQEWLTRARSQLTSAEVVAAVTLPVPPPSAHLPLVVVEAPASARAPAPRRIPGWVVGATVAGGVLIISGAVLISSLVR